MKIAVLADIHGNLAALHAAIDDIDGTYADWFGLIEREVVLVRPDFYVFGSSATLAGADRLVRELGPAIALRR